MRNIDLLEKHDRSLKIVAFFKNTPWAEEYNGLERELLYGYLEVNYLDQSGQPYPRNSKFLENLESAINREKQNLLSSLSPNTPPPLAPDFITKLEDMMIRYEDAKKQKVRNPKKFLLTDIQETSKILRQQWELERQEILLVETQGQTTLTKQNLANSLTPTLTNNIKFAQLQNTNPTLTQNIENSLSQKLITDQKTAPTKLLQDAISEELQKINITQLGAEQLAEDVVQNAAKDQIDDITNVSESLRGLNEAENFSQRYRDLLYDKITGAPTIRNQQFEDIHEIAREKATIFAASLIPHLKNAGFTDEDINERLPKFIDHIRLSTAESPFVSEIVYPQKEFNDLLKDTIEVAIKTHFNPRGIRSIVPLLNKVIGKDEKTRYDTLINETKKTLATKPDLPTIFKTASYNTYSANKNSLEGGDPLGRIPYVIKIEILKARNPTELAAIIRSLTADTEIKISPSQLAALSTIQNYIADFQIKYPALAGITSLYYRNMLKIGVAKVTVSTLLWHPDYALYIPVYWAQVAKAQIWELKWKPRLIRHLIEKTPIGGIVGLWYHRNDWGLYENPIERAKHAVGNFVVKKSINFAGKVTYKIGSFFGSEKITNTGLKLLSGELLGKLAGLWTVSGTIIKKILKWTAAGIGLIFLWAATYGPLAITGFLISLGAGIAAGVKVGLVVSAVAGPIVGVFAGAVTTFLVTFLGTGFTVWLINHGLIPSGLGAGAISAPSLNITGVVHAANLPAAALPITGVFVGVLTASQVLYYSFLQANFNPFRQLGPNIDLIEIKSKELEGIFQEAANAACIPVAALKAISQIEASGVWGYSTDEVKRFSEDGWWNNASQEEKNRGYCYDTCQDLTLNCAKLDREKGVYCTKEMQADPNYNCQTTTVMGPMQFEELTWANRFGKDNLMKRCHLPTAIQAAAQKIKAASADTKPCAGKPYEGTWDKGTMQQAAKGYCGSCGTSWCPTNDTQCIEQSRACGEDYCGNAWTLYQQYSTR